jgi:chemotaxis protein CheZ
METTSSQNGGDSADLQALFDSITTAGLPPTAPAPETSVAGDSDDLQALFDSVAETPRPAIHTTASHEPQGAQEAVFNRIGHLTRQLHDSLRALGADKTIEASAKQIPDARQRLAYISQMTEQAASRVLNATDIAMPLQDALLSDSKGLAQRWERMFANQLSVADFKALAADTRNYFSTTPGKLEQTNAQLLEIMMAQDFQDLTGQVIKKVIDLVQDLESQLLSLLIEAMPEQRKAEAPEGLLNGPVINSTGRTDIVTDQAQVDDLLESLGF